MKLFILEAETFTMPGRVRKLFVSRAQANIEAAELANILLDEADMRKNATADNWQKRVEAAQKKRKSETGYIEVEEIEVEDATGERSTKSAASPATHWACDY